MSICIDTPDSHGTGISREPIGAIGSHSLVGEGVSNRKPNHGVLKYAVAEIIWALAY